MGDEKTHQQIQFDPSDESNEKLNEYFKSKINEWKYYIIMGETFSNGLFDDLNKVISSEQAFNLILPASKIVLEQIDPDLFTTSLSLMNEIISISNTTELPIGLKDQLKKIKELNLKFNKDAKILMKSINEWYRIEEEL